jgi:hypothetical protein
MNYFGLGTFAPWVFPQATSAPVRTSRATSVGVISKYFAVRRLVRDDKGKLVLGQTPF